MFVVFSVCVCVCMCILDGEGSQVFDISRVLVVISKDGCVVSYILISSLFHTVLILLLSQLMQRKLWKLSSSPNNMKEQTVPSILQ